MRPILLLIGILVQFPALAVTLNIDADSLKDASGNPMASGVIVLVADVKDVPGPNGTLVRNGFSGPTASSFSGNDFLVYRWNFEPGSPVYFDAGSFQAAIKLSFSGQWKAGDPLRLYWFPQNTAADTSPGPGKPFGTFRSNSAEAGSSSSFAWITPSESATLSLNGETASVPKESTVSLAFLTSDASALVPPGASTRPASAGNANSTMVVGRYLFYNGSSWDGSNAGPDANDDNAIAPDKVPLFPGTTATFANYSSYTRGLNGIMVDISNPANGPQISAADFTFKIGNDNSPAAWAPAPAPVSVTRRAGAGFNGSDRFTIIWANNAIQKQWLEVAVLPTTNTGLNSPEVFYFGNAIGESGNSTANAQVNISDEIAARNNLNPIGPVPLTNPYDYNRDKRINISDEIAARNNLAVGTALKLITP